MAHSGTMKKPVILITGSTDGIGKATALEAARQGADVVIHGRSPERVASTQDEILDATGVDAHGVVANLGSLDAVRAMAEQIHEEIPNLNVLINNAGVISKTRRLSYDGYELTFAVNHLAHFLLTNLLLPLLRTNTPARVVTVSSVVHHGAGIEFENLMGEEEFDGYAAYEQSKLANVLFTTELARRESGSGVTAICMHPGVISTKLLHEYFGGGSPTIEGARNILTPTLDPRYAEFNGRYFTDGRPAEPDDAAADRDVSLRLWDESLRLCGLS